MATDEGQQAELERYYRAIGRLSVEFGRLETGMHLLTWHTIRLTSTPG